MPDDVAHQKKLQRSKAFEIQGLFAQGLNALMPAGECGDPIIAGQALRLCLLSARWDELGGWDERYCELLERHIEQPGTEKISPGLLNYLPGREALHDKVAGLFARQLCSANPLLNIDDASAGARDRPLKIGYLSADFQEHAVGFLLADLFAAHDRDRVRVYAYDLHAVDSPLALRIRQGFDVSRSVHRLSNANLAKLIAQDGIQILIDLAGYSHLGRPGALAMRPAPVILSWLGYLNTMNARFVDGVIADPVLLPASDQNRYRETVHHLPGPFTPTSILPVADKVTRSQHGLPDDRFVFACFNNAFKLRPEDLKCWSKILDEVDESVLWLYSAGHRDFEAGVRQQAEQLGIDPTRLIFAPWLPMDQHMARMSLADLFLDTFNYNAGATAVCALSAGVPVLTRAGRTMLSRMGSSLNTALGQDVLSAADEGQYVTTAVEMAIEPGRLAAIRSMLAPNREPSNPLFPIGDFAAAIETLYENAWTNAVPGATDNATRQ